MIQAGDIVYKIRGDLAGLESALKTAKSKLSEVGTKAGEISENVGKKFTVAGGVIVGALGLAVQESNQFRSALAEVSTLGVKDMKTLEEGVKSVSSRFGKDLTESTKAAYQIISATGLDAAEATLFLAESTKAAVAGVANVSSAVTLGAGVMNAYGKTVDDIGSIYDEAFIAVKNGVTTFEELSASVGKLSPIFSAAGLTSQEMFAGITALTGAGINTAEAVTGLKAAITNVIKPTSEALKVAQDLGIEFNAAALESKGLGGFMEELKTKTGGNIETMSKLFGSVEGLAAVLAISGEQSELFNRTMDEMKSGVRAADEAFKKIVENDPTFVWKQLSADLQILRNDIAVAIGPELLRLSEWLKGVAASVRAWKSENPELFDQIVKWTAGIGAAMAVLGPMMVVIPSIVTSIGALTGAIKAVGVAMLATPFGQFTLAITGIGWAVKSLYDDWDWMWPEMKRIFWDVTRSLEQTWQEWSGALSRDFEKVKTLIGEGWTQAWDAAKASFNEFRDWVFGWKDSIVNSFTNLKSEVADKMSGFLGAVTSPLTAAKDTMVDFGTSIMKWFGKSTWIDYFENLENKASQHFGGFSRVVDANLSMAKAAMVAMLPVLVQTSSALEVGGGRAVVAGQEFTLAANALTNLSSKVRFAGEEFVVGASQVEAGGRIVSATGEVFKVAAAKVGEAARETSPALQEVLKNIEGNADAMKGAIPHHEDYAKSWYGIGESALAAMNTIKEFYTGSIGAGGPISRGGPNGGGSVAHILGIHTLQEIAAVTGKTLSQLQDEYRQYFMQQLNLWRMGNETIILGMEEWANQMLEIGNFSAGQFLDIIQSNMSGAVGAVASATSEMLTLWKTAQSAMGTGSTTTLQIPTPTSGAGRGFASGGVTDHPIVKVGELGPELVALPVGSRVMSHSDMMTAAKGFASGGVVSWWERFAGKAGTLPQIRSIGGAMDFSRMNQSAVANLRYGPQGDGSAQAWLREMAYLNEMYANQSRAGNERMLDLRSALSLRTGVGGIDSALSARGGSGAAGTGGGSVTITGPLVHIDRVDASSAGEVDAFLEKTSEAFFSRLSAKGMGVNVGYAA